MSSPKSMTVSAGSLAMAEPQNGCTGAGPKPQRAPDLKRQGRVWGMDWLGRAQSRKNPACCCPSWTPAASQAGGDSATGAKDAKPSRESQAASTGASSAN